MPVIQTGAPSLDDRRRSQEGQEPTWIGHRRRSGLRRRGGGSGRRRGGDDGWRGRGSRLAGNRGHLNVDPSVLAVISRVKGIRISPRTILIAGVPRDRVAYVYI